MGPRPAAALPDFADGGEMGGRILAHDWTGSPIGGPAAWPAALRSALALILAAPVPMALAWGDDLILLYNDAFCAMLGAARLDLIGRPMAEALTTSWDRLAPLVERVRGGSAQVAPEFGFATNPGAPEAWCRLALSPARGDDGTIAGILCVCSELADKALPGSPPRETEARYRALFESMDDGFCVIEFIDGPDGPLSDYIHVEANEAYARNAGIPNVVGQKVREMVPEEAAGWVELYGSVLHTGRPIQFERELVATGRYLGVSSFRVEPATRNEVAVLFKDITARKRAEAELQAVNATLEARVAAALAERRILADIVEGNDAFVQVLDTGYRFMAVNGASAREFERLFGVRPQVGDRLDDVLAALPEQIAIAHALWDRAFAGEELAEVSTVGGTGRDARHYELRLNTLRDESGRIIGAYQFGYDVTDRVREQERLRETEDALRQAQKMEAVGQLTGGLAHDFNNLLAGISGAFEMIGVRLAQGRSADVDRYLVAGQGAARRAASLTHRLLAFARRQTLSPKPIVVNRLLADLVDLVQRTVGPAIQVETIAAGGLWPSLVDANQLENAILNLCINARDAMPSGGRITVETANKWLDDRTARERGLDPGQYVTVCVSDTGTGIDKEILARVFDPFFTTKPIGQGTGLGLSMVYGFARQSNGHVRIYSELGQGTMVCIYLPRHHGGDEADAELTLPVAPDGHASGRVLVIDDEPTVRMLILDALGDLGFACLEAGDGAAGLRILETTENIDLLITDVGLPGGLNGRQVADAARALRPDLKILFITGYAENAVLNHGHIQHGMEVLTKPFAIDDLAARVDRILRER